MRQKSRRLDRASHCLFNLITTSHLVGTHIKFKEFILSPRGFGVGWAVKVVKVVWLACMVRLVRVVRVVRLVGW